MSIDRRQLLAGSAASALTLSCADKADALLPQGNPSLGWQTLPLGGGGFITGIDFALDGTKVCKTDVYGAYIWTVGASQWVQVCNYNSLGTTVSGGVWEIRVAPSLSSRLYMISNTAVNTQHVFRSNNSGSAWTQTNLSMINGRADGQYNNRLTNQKMAIDPNNPDVVYVGLPNGSTPNNGVWRCTDGSTFSQLSTISASNEDPGTAGIVFDANYSPATIVVDFGGGNQKVTTRVLIPVGGVGIYESTDGGVTFSLASSDPTPSTTINYTTTQANSVIIIQAMCFCDGAVTGVTNTASSDGTSGLTWNLRAGPQTNTYAVAALYEYYAVAPTTGTYAITITYGGGRFGVFNGSVCNQVGVFALTGVDVSSPPSSIFESGGPVSNIGPLGGGTEPSITTTGTKDFVFSFSYTSGTTAEPGYHLINQNTTNKYWSEISSAVVGPGTYRPGQTNANDGYGFITDAVKQKAGGTLAIDGTPQYATSGPSSGSQPVDITTAQIDHSGTYWAINGPTYRTNGGVWRYKSGTWNQMNGSGGLQNGYPVKSSQGNCVCVDPRAGYEGHITVAGPNHTYWGYQTANGNAAAASVTWVGSTGGGSQSISSPIVGWQTIAGLTAMGDMLINPIDGTYWCANGLGVQQFPTTLNYDSRHYSVSPAWHSEGIEELNATDALVPPGGSQLLVAVQDRNVMLTSLPGFPLTYWNPGTDSDGFQLDYASANPNFVCVYNTGIISGAMSAYSLNYGVIGSWVMMVNQPGTALGGCIAAASATDATHANMVCIPGAGTATPIYTMDNGSRTNGGWQTCSGVPAESYLQGNFNQRTRVLAADRVNIGTFYIYCPGYNSRANAGFYKSTDGGATFSKQSPGITMPAGVGNGWTLFSTPGFAGHLWLANCQYSNTLSVIQHSQDGGANWRRANNNVDQVLIFGMGKASPTASPANYPTLFMLGNVSGVQGFYLSTDKGVTWTSFGTFRGSLPVSCQLDSPLGIRGDWNVYGRCYLVMYSSGAAYYSS